MYVKTEKVDLSLAVTFVVISCFALNAFFTRAWELSGTHITSTGLVGDRILVDVTVDFNDLVGFNNLSLGSQIHGYDDFPNKPLLQQKASALNLKIVRVFVDSEKMLDICSYWNETTYTGVFNWQELDELVDAIYSIGAEPLLNIGSGVDPEDYRIPNGMTRNFNGTRFPSPKSFGLYVAEIIKHLKSTNREVRFWEIWRTPRIRDEADIIDPILVLNYTNFFNEVQSYIHSVDSDALVSSDRMFYKPFFDVFVELAQGVGFLTYMKYDAFGTPFYRPEGYLSDRQVMEAASSLDQPTGGAWAKYSPREMQSRWAELRGETLPVVVCESNLNSSFSAGTDERVQTPLGAVWYAEVLRSFILDGAVRHSIYFRLVSDESTKWGENRTRGWGLGMMKSNSPYDEWPSYWVNYLFGTHLHEGDILTFANTSHFDSLSALAWEGTGRYILLIGKSDHTLRVNVSIRGIDGGGFVQVVLVKNTLSRFSLRVGSFDSPLTVEMQGYSVMLLMV